MASIARDPHGQKRILFMAPDGSRKTIRLGKCSSRLAESVKTKIEDLVSAKITGHSPSDETSRWVSSLEAELADKLASVGLIPQRQTATVASLLSDFLAANPHAKPATVVVWGQVARGLREHFGEGRPLRTIGRAEAMGFRQYLIDEGLAATTIHKRLQFARHFFSHALRAEHIAKNPFADVAHKSGDPSKRQRYVTAEETQRLIDSAPNWVWRTIIVLVRFGGLRCPSEVLSLTLAGLDWERGAMLVASPKGEGHGKGHRTVPMFPRLRPYLEEAWAMAKEGQTHVIPEDLYLPAAQGPRGWVNSNLRTTFAKIIDRAGLERWPRLFHALRASCESDLAREYPITTVCKWIGNTVAIAARHYVQVTDSDFQRAAQIPAQSASEMGCQALHPQMKNPGFAGVYEGVRNYTNVQVEAAGIEPASRDISGQASTCVVGSFRASPSRPPTDGAPDRLVENLV